jgi:hypothetical protein
VDFIAFWRNRIEELCFNKSDKVLCCFDNGVLEKKMAFLTQLKTKLCKNLIIALVFKKNAIFSPKIGKIA